MIIYDVHEKSDYEFYLKDLIENGFTKIKFSAVSHKNQIKQDILKIASQFSNSEISDLSKIHEKINLEKINDFRLEVLNYLNSKTNVKNELIDKTLPLLKTILGNDLVVQKNLNLVMLPPDDPTSLLPLHADTWTGHSSFELVVLYSFLPTLEEQNMFLLPLKQFKEKISEFKNFSTLQEMTHNFEPYLHKLNLAEDEAVILWHSLPHGNKVNQSRQTHWSLNLRFKNAFTPYGEKNIGDYFQPLCLSPFNEFVRKESIYSKSLFQKEFSIK